jgi:hypothetical protein
MLSSDGFCYFVIFMDAHNVETSLTLLGQCKAPLKFWTYAFKTSVYLINHMPTLVMRNKSPFECLLRQPPN